MSKSYTLKMSGGEWALHDQFGELIHIFKTKADALRRGALEKAVGEGRVSIHREDGQLEEERTLPHSADPRSTPNKYQPSA